MDPLRRRCLHASTAATLAAGATAVSRGPLAADTPAPAGGYTPCVPRGTGQPGAA